MKGCKNGDKIFSVFSMISGANDKIIAKAAVISLFREHGEFFVKERYYGVCDNLIYSDDAVNDTRDILGAE